MGDETSEPLRFRARGRKTSFKKEESAHLEKRVKKTGIRDRRNGDRGSGLGHLRKHGSCEGEEHSYRRTRKTRNRRIRRQCFVVKSETEEERGFRRRLDGVESVLRKIPRNRGKNV